MNLLKLLVIGTLLFLASGILLDNFTTWYALSFIPNTVEGNPHARRMFTNGFWKFYEISMFSFQLLWLSGVCTFLHIVPPKVRPYLKKEILLLQFGLIFCCLLFGFTGVRRTDASIHNMEVIGWI